MPSNPNFAAPPIRSPYPGEPGIFSRAWQQWFQAVTNYFNTPVTITGNTGGNSALESLIKQLAAKGIVIDNTTP